MNDFTKEELEELDAMLNRHMFDAINKRIANILHKKLQYMIDNYCEPMNKDNPMYKCIRCDSKEIDEYYEIKNGLHNWFLCVECSLQFSDWVRDKHADNGCSWAKAHFKRKYGDKR